MFNPPAPKSTCQFPGSESSDFVGQFPSGLNPMADNAYRKAAGAYHGGDSQRALHFYNRAIQWAPKHAPFFRERGLVYLSTRELDKAHDDLNKAIRIDPRYAIAFNDRSLIWHFKEQYKKAIANCDQAIHLDSRYAQAYCRRGFYWTLASNLQQAIADYQQAIRLCPKDGVAYSY